MNEENNPGAGVEIIVSELELGKQRIIEDNISIQNINLVTMTEMIANKSDSRENEISMDKQDSQLLNDLESPMENFLFIDSEQSSEKEEDAYVTSMTNQVKILKFEDTLADEDYRQFKSYIWLLTPGR